MARKEADDVVLDTMNDDTGADMEFPPAVRGTMELGAVQGEFDPGELQLPRLQIAYGVGGLSENFNPGDLVLGGENLIVKKGEPMNIIILNVTRYWKERLTSEAYAAGLRPKSFATEKEVNDMGGITRWPPRGSDGPKPDFNQALNMKLLIEKPSDLVCALFGIPVGDKEYAPAVWDIDKSAYKRIEPVVMQAAKFSLRTRGLLSGTFSIMTRSEKINNNATIVPVIKLAAHNSDEMIEEIKVLFAPQAQTQEG